MDGFEKLEQMPGIKLVPLFIKNAVVNLFNTLEAKKSYPDPSPTWGRIPTAKTSMHPYHQRLYGRFLQVRLPRSPRSVPMGMILFWAPPGRSAATEMLKKLLPPPFCRRLDITLYATEVDGE